MIPTFIDSSLDPSEALLGSFDPLLVLLSYLIAGLASFCALTIVQNNLHDQNGKGAKRFWHTCGAVAMGTGVWAMHFIGMLAFRLPIGIQYDPLITAVSILPSICASWVVIGIITKKSLKAKNLVLGGTLMGVGIGGMHYCGMAGMKLDAMMYYEPSLFAVSIIAAVGLSIASLYTTYKLKGQAHARPLFSRIAGALIMGLAVGTMHYTAMFATHYFDTCVPDSISSTEMDFRFLGSTVTIASVLIVGLTTIAGIVDHNIRSAAASADATQKFLSQVLEHTQQGFFQTDLNGEIQKTNKAFCRILALDELEIIGKTISEFTNPETAKRYPDLRSELRSGRFEITLINAKGDSTTCLYHATEAFDEKGNANGMVGLLTDITELREQEAQSKEKAENVSMILNNLTSGVVLIDEESRIQLFNESCEKMFGYTKEEVFSKNATLLVDPEDQQSFNEYISCVTPRASRFANKEFIARRKDGSTFPIEFGANELTIDCRVMFVGALIDVTRRTQEQKRREELEQELLQSSKLEAVGQLAGGIAHEINTPIQFIGDNLDFLETEFSNLLPLIESISKSLHATSQEAGAIINDAALKKNLEEIDFEFLASDIPQAISQSLTGVKDVSRIVRSMKEFSHPNAKNTQAFDIRNAIENTLSISKAEWKNVAEVDFEFAEDTPQIQCFPGAINQVLLNLLVNAAHAIAEAKKPGTGKITIKTRKHLESLVVTISDTGTGIPEEIQKKIFDPFFTTKEVGRGTGQGLAISWDIVVKKHGGTISLETIPGEGTTFTIELPIAGKTSTEAEQLS